MGLRRSPPKQKLAYGFNLLSVEFNMKNLLLTLLIFAPLAAVGDMVNIYGANRWSRIDSHTIIVYRGSKALCLVKTWGYVFSSSRISFVDDTISNFDKMIIDGKAEDIREVKRL